MRIPVGTRDRAGENQSVNSPLPMAADRSLVFLWTSARAKAFMGGRCHRVDPFRIVFVFLGQFDVPVVVLDFHGVGQAPQQQGGLLQHDLPLEQQFPEVFTARFCPAQVWEISTQKSSLFRSSHILMARSVALWPS